jgi:hypothetical protein
MPLVSDDREGEERRRGRRVSEWRRRENLAGKQHAQKQHRRRQQTTRGKDNERN